jgi:hypothetical protein
MTGQMCRVSLGHFIPTHQIKTSNLSTDASSLLSLLITFTDLAPFPFQFMAKTTDKNERRPRIVWSPHVDAEEVQN